MELAESPLLAALSGSRIKASGFAGGYLLKVDNGLATSADAIVSGTTRVCIVVVTGSNTSGTLLARRCKIAVSRISISGVRKTLSRGQGLSDADFTDFTSVQTVFYGCAAGTLFNVENIIKCADANIGIIFGTNPDISRFSVFSQPL
jgi:hypothetical protein